MIKEKIAVANDRTYLISEDGRVFEALPAAAQKLREVASEVLEGIEEAMEGAGVVIDRWQAALGGDEDDLKDLPNSDFPVHPDELMESPELAEQPAMEAQNDEPLAGLPNSDFPVHPDELAESPELADQPAMADADEELIVEALGEAEAEEAADEAAPEADAEAEEADATAAAEAKAEELGVDLSEVEGSGADGRILVSDVEDAAEEG